MLSLLFSARLELCTGIEILAGGTPVVSDQWLLVDTLALSIYQVCEVPQGG